MIYKCQFCPKELDNELQRIFHEQLHENEKAPHKYENKIGYDICRFCGENYANEVHLKQYERRYPHDLITIEKKSCLYCKEHYPNQKCPHVEIDEQVEHKDQWFCIYCDEWHLKTELCSVYEVRSMRDERYERMLND